VVSGPISNRSCLYGHIFPAWDKVGSIHGRSIGCKVDSWRLASHRMRAMASALGTHPKRGQGTNTSFVRLIVAHLGKLKCLVLGRPTAEMLVDGLPYLGLPVPKRSEF